MTALTVTDVDAPGPDGILRIGRPPTAPVTPPVVALRSGVVRRFVVETTGSVIAVVAMFATLTTVPLFWV